jgi:hypothetical protein
MNKDPKDFPKVFHPLEMISGTHMIGSIPGLPSLYFTFLSSPFANNPPSCHGCFSHPGYCVIFKKLK